MFATQNLNKIDIPSFDLFLFHKFCLSYSTLGLDKRDSPAESDSNSENGDSTAELEDTDLKHFLNKGNSQKKKKC